MSKQIIVTVSEAFQAFLLATCAAYQAPGKTKGKMTDLTQREFSDAALAVLAENHTDPETGEVTTNPHPDFVAAVQAVLESRGNGDGSATKGTVSRAKFDKLAADLELMIKQLKNLNHPDATALLADCEAKLAEHKAASAPKTAATPPPLPGAPEGVETPVAAPEGVETPAPVADEIPA
jgi:hypothetical protein